MKISKKNKVIAIAIITVVLLTLILPNSKRKEVEKQKTTELNQKKKQMWTCSMHPQIRLGHPGKCPICGMTLIPVANEESGSQDFSPNALILSEYAKTIAEIRTVRAKRGDVIKNISLTGKISFNEENVQTITSRIAGRIDKMFVSYVGEKVYKGKPLGKIYSPELVALQDEILSATKYAKGDDDIDLVASKEKLRLLGFPSSEADRIIKKGKPFDYMSIVSPQSGVVYKKHINEGAYVKTGTSIYTVVDLSSVWVMLDAYESDLAWIKLGQKIKFYVEALPGKVFDGHVSFIDPFIDPKTRTAKVRVIAQNRRGFLKPEMFVKANIISNLTAGSKTKLITKEFWTCSMHPEIKMDKPGECPKCGMNLEMKTKKIKITEKGRELPVLIPVSAPLFTGKKSIVFIEKNNKKGFSYEPREVVLGVRTNDSYEVVSGIEEGENVVINGAFKIDADLQIRAKPSMMTPNGGAQVMDHSKMKM